MKPSEAFGVVVRTLGLLFALAGIAYGVTVAILLLGSEATHGGYGVLAYVLCFIMFCGIGLYFLRGAPLIVRFAYRETKEETESFQPQD